MSSARRESRDEVARWMLEQIRDAYDRGRPVPPAVLDHVRDLLNPPSFEPETNFESPDTLEINTAERAARMGCTPQYVRRLCREGGLLARRHGRDWLITIRGSDGDEKEHGRETLPVRG
ncbi:helix-turn-helix domain-containing protein [Thermostaphylospora chromogena]|uniref:Helix-turn-helix domain-containing protein n=1 Tax=Thermostaphylospora chromogena TaxID=35622 RepID=A0A1H1CWV6_9ACTN|nr:helix-turn-helix domain-containing protein [Thermostaphylospora chromogena]SDQ68713.1 hypothetical protein SAMN04489764_1694 [Thermostaphylospora chromogena]